MKNTITEMKNKLEGINSRLNDTEKLISELENSLIWVEITEAEQKKSEKKWGQFERDHWDNRPTNIHMIGVPEGEEKEKGAESHICRHNSWKPP